MPATTVNLSFHGQALSTEIEPQGNGSVLTITSPINSTPYMQKLFATVEGWEVFVQRQYGREATATLENNQIVCRIEIAPGNMSEVMTELETRLKNAPKAREAGAGGDLLGGSSAGS